MQLSAVFLDFQTFDDLTECSSSIYRHIITFTKEGIDSYYLVILRPFVVFLLQDFSHDFFLIYILIPDRHHKEFLSLCTLTL